MPEGDLVLAKPPAEQHLFLSAPGGKVDEALVEILDENTERAQRLDGVRNLRRLALDHSAQLVDLVRPDPAAVACDLRGYSSMPDGRDGEQAAVRDHLLHERAHLREQLVRLLRR